LHEVEGPSSAASAVTAAAARPPMAAPKAAVTSQKSGGHKKAYFKKVNFRAASKPKVPRRRPSYVSRSGPKSAEKLLRRSSELSNLNKHRLIAELVLDGLHAVADADGAWPGCQRCKSRSSAQEASTLIECLDCEVDSSGRTCTLCGDCDQRMHNTLSACDHVRIIVRGPQLGVPNGFRLGSNEFVASEARSSGVVKVGVCNTFND
jgi:hypothetical protein